MGTEETEKNNITDSQIISALEEPVTAPEPSRIDFDFRLVQRVFSRSLALLMLSLALATGILVSSVATSFIDPKHSWVLAGFKIFCILASLVLIIISIFLVLKISTPQEGRPRNTLREYY